MSRRKLLKIIGLSAVAAQVPFLPKEQRALKITGSSIDDSGSIIINSELCPFEEELDNDFRKRLLKKDRIPKGELFSLHLDGKSYPVKFN